MGWRKPEQRDLVAKLNQKELAAFKQHPEYASSADPAEDILSQTAEFVRGACRTNRQIRLSPDEKTIPESLISPAMDVAAFDILKRINVIPNDARKSAWEKALDLFEKVASGGYIPESWRAEGETDTDAVRNNNARPKFLPRQRRFVLNEYI